MADIDLKSFPFDSMEVLNEQSGQMEPDRQYLAEIFRNYFAKFLSNGVYYGSYKNYGDNSMKVTADTGLSIKVLKGAGIIEGADFENEEDRLITLERPANGNRIDRIVVQFNASLEERKTKLIVKQGNGTTPASLTRTENIYEICLAEVTVRSTSNITASDVIDKRTDTNLCGIVDSLISVSGEELYQDFQAYIDSVTANLVRKDQNSVINGNITANSVQDPNGKSLSKNDFSDAYKNKLDGIEAQANKYIHPTSAGNKHIPSGGSSGQILRWKSNGEAEWITQGVATTSANGLMSAADKTKLNGIATGANKTTVSNSLNDSSTTNALSANQGKVLNTNKLDKSGGNLTGQLKTHDLIPDDDLVYELGSRSKRYSNAYVDIIHCDIIYASDFDDINCENIDCDNIDCNDIICDNIRSEHTYDSVVSGSPNLYITSSYNFRRVASSSKRYKKNITDKIEERLNPERLYNLPIKQFKYKEGCLSKEDKRYNENILGFIVEDLQEVFEPAVEYNEDGTPEMWNYKVMIPAMLQLIQNQKKEIDDLKERVSKLEGAD